VVNAGTRNSPNGMIGWRSPPLDPDEDRERDEGDRQQSEHERRAPVMVSAERQRGEQRDDGRGQCDRPDHVDVAARRGRSHRGHPADDDRERREAQWQVDVEDPPPAEGVGQNSAERRPDHRSEGERAAEDPLHPRTHLRRIDVRDHREHG